jgi:hypothetical protein
MIYHACVIVHIQLYMHMYIYNIHMYLYTLDVKCKVLKCHKPDCSQILLARVLFPSGHFVTRSQPASSRMVLWYAVQVHSCTAALVRL